MLYASESIIKALKEKRVDKGLTQRAFAQEVSSPQSHIARIESGKTDPKLSTVIELARTLEMEVMVIPRQLVPIVQSLVRGASKPKEGEEASTPRAAYALTEDEDEDE
jgi:predicted transcriptional regulator